MPDPTPAEAQAWLAGFRDGLQADPTPAEAANPPEIFDTDDTAREFLRALPHGPIPGTLVTLTPTRKTSIYVPAGGLACSNCEGIDPASCLFSPYPTGDTP